MNCLRCNTPVSPGANFCGNCGAPVPPPAPSAQQPVFAGAANEPVPQVGDPQGVFRSGDVTVRIEGELVPVVDVELGGRENIYFEHHVLLW